MRQEKSFAKNKKEKKRVKNMNEERWIQKPRERDGLCVREIEREDHHRNKRLFARQLQLCQFCSSAWNEKAGSCKI